MNKTITINELFGQIDFKKKANDPDFKEDSVREVIILPILKQLPISVIISLGIFGPHK